MHILNKSYDKIVYVIYIFKISLILFQYFKITLYVLSYVGKEVEEFEWIVNLDKYERAKIVFHNMRGCVQDLSVCDFSVT